MNAGDVNSSDSYARAVVFIGTLEDCKLVLHVLEAAGICGAFHDVERVRPDLRSRGYYLVSVAPEEYERARALVEARLAQDLPGAKPWVSDDIERCPACGTALPVQCAACPDCGLIFE
ncbi:MAG: hypothetical protein N2595_02425 [bacterium]|nr:hypothetical protein [bacterium]